MYREDVDPESGCRLPLPRREQLDDAGKRTYDSLADPQGRDDQRAEGPWRYPASTVPTSRDMPGPAQPLSATRGGVGGRVRELAILTTARELGGQF